MNIDGASSLANDEVKIFKFVDVFDEANFLLNQIGQLKSIDMSFVIATGSKILSSTLYSMNDILVTVDYSYEKFLVIQVAKFLLDLNYDYENKELNAMYGISDVYETYFRKAQCTRDEEDDFKTYLLFTWNLQRDLINKIINENEKIAALLNYLDAKLNDYFGGKFNNTENEFYDYVMIDENNIANRKHVYIAILRRILEKFDHNDSIDHNNAIISLDQIKWFRANKLYVAGLSELDFYKVYEQFDETFKHYDSIYFSSHYDFKLEMPDKCQNRKITIIEPNIPGSCMSNTHNYIAGSEKFSSQVKEKCKFGTDNIDYIEKDLSLEFEKLEFKSVPQNMHESCLGKLDEDILAFYVRAVLRLKFINYDINEYVPYHVKNILMRYLVNFDDNVVDIYLNEHKFFIIDNIKIKLKSNNILKKIAHILNYHKIIEKYTNVYATVYLHAGAIINIRSHYDFMALCQNRIGILFKFVFINFSAKDVKSCSNLYVNTAILAAFKILSKYNLLDIKIYFIDQYNVFEVMLSEFDYQRVSYISEMKLRIMLNNKHDFNCTNISKTYKLNQLVRKL